METEGTVVGGQYVNATIRINTKGELALTSAGFRRTPNLTADMVASWEEVVVEQRGSSKSSSAAASKIGQSAVRAALPGSIGKVAANAVGAALGAAVEGQSQSVHTVRVDWADGTQSLVELPHKLFRHLAIMLKDRQVGTTSLSSPTSPSTPSAPARASTSQTTEVIGGLTKLAGAVRGPAPDALEQVGKLAALKEQGAITEEEFAAKKAELLGIQVPAAVSAEAEIPPALAPATAPEPVPAPEPVAAPEPIPAPAPDPVLPAAPTPPPTWAPDPMGRHEHRYWDGTQWTHHVSNGGQQATDPV